MAQPSSPDSKFHYFSSVEGHLVPRYATFQQAVTQYIGATRRGKEVTWNVEEVVAIHESEFKRYRREFRAALASNALTVRTKEDHESWLAKLAEQDAQNEEAAKESSAAPNEPTGNTGGASQQPVAPSAKSEDVKQRGAKQNK